MIYIIKTHITGKKQEERFYTKGDAVAYYRVKIRELSFPDTIDIEVLNDGES